MRRSTLATVLLAVFISYLATPAAVKPAVTSERILSSTNRR